MKDVSKDEAIGLVRKALAQMPDNPFELSIDPDSAYNVDGRWWVVLQVGRPPAHRYVVWGAVAELEDQLDDADARVSVTAA
jgi:hypothetical protein